MTLRTLESPPSVQASTTRTFLPEVQALRALAVMLVVVYHFWPDSLTGGYVGVDVFFVISGFLITSHLHRELASRGTISLRAFYARRARRLLPASLLVLLCTAVASWVLLPATRWATTAHEVLASTFYVQNWVLATRAVDYSALDDAASPVQHFWSLSVEEQFYLLWPSLVLLLVLVARRSGSGRRDSALLPGILLVTLLSFGCSVLATWLDPAAAYFVTPTRIWELGAGALLALWLTDRGARDGIGSRAPSAGPVLLRWGGVVAVLGSAVLLSSASPFPGHLALVPVLGTAAVIAAGDTGPRDPLTPVFGLRATQFLGAVSYSLYLWHWPAIVLAPFLVGRPLRGHEEVLLLVGVIALSWVTKVAVEDRTQRLRVLVTRPVRTAGLTVAAMAVVSSVAALQLYGVSQREAAARADLAAADGRPCFGAGSMAPDSGCGDPFGPPVSTALTEEDEPWFDDPACVLSGGELEVSTCRFGEAPPSRRVALVGDSHADHWRGALHRIAEQQNWELVEVLKGACPAARARVLTFEGDGVDTEACSRWGAQVDRMLTTDPPDYVFTSSFGSAYTFEAGRAGNSFDAGARGFSAAWTAWAEAGAQVFVLQDIPTTGDRQVPECVTVNEESPAACSLPREAAFPADPARAGLARVDPGSVRPVDLTDFFCDDTTCHAVVGGALVYWDANHMSAQFSRTLAPFLLEQVQDGTGS